MSDCVFCKIVNKELPATIYYEDDLVMVIKNINPLAKFHALAIPKNHLILNQTTRDDLDILGDLILASKTVAIDEALTEGYRLVINNGRYAHQEIEHLHVHILGGEDLGAMNSHEHD